MTRLVPAALAVAVGTFVAASAAVAQQARVALVIGNSAYDTAPLGNPKNDAEDLGRELQNLGFEVVRVTDANKRGMEEAIRSLGGRLNSRSIGLFYYAGHAVQDRLGRNFLIPIGANVKSEADLPYEAVDVSLLLDHLEQAGAKLNIVILDSCRNNPFRAYYRSASSGLAPVNASSSSGTFVIYATQPGNTAADGEGRNSPFAKHLLSSLRQPESYIHRVFARVITGVYEETGHRQRPWVSHSLSEDFYFRAAESAPAAAAQALPDALAAETTFWNSVKERDARELRAYLEEYPKGRFANLALARLQGLQSDKAAIPRTDSSPPNRLLPRVLEFFLEDFSDVLDTIVVNYVSRPNERLLVDGCISGMAALAGGSVKVRYTATNDFTDDRSRNRATARLIVGDAYRAIKAGPEPLEDRVMTERCLAGMVATLPDAGDAYLNTAEFRELQVGAERARAAGIGVELKLQQGRPAIWAVIEGGPAELAGVRAGDVLLRVAGVDTTGWSLQKAIEHLRGAPGTQVDLHLLRPVADRTDAIDAKVTRAFVRVAPVDTALLRDVAYVRLRSFAASSPGLVADRLGAVIHANPRLRGIVIDLRANTGGLVYASLAIASAFSRPGATLITNRGRSEDVNRTHVADLSDGKRRYSEDKLAALSETLRRLPIAVLIDSQSAAGAEILAGALRQQRGAFLIGERSAGHNSVQTIMPLGNNTAVKLTTARWYLPNGESVRDRGLEPDVRVDQTGLTSEQRGKPAADPALARAIAYLEAGK